MNRPFWMKLILGIVTFMILMQGILPTNIVFAVEDPDYKSRRYDYEKVDDISKDGWYIPFCEENSFLEGRHTLKGFVNMPESIYYIDETTNKIAFPPTSGDCEVYLESDKTYYVARVYFGDGSYSSIVDFMTDNPLLPAATEDFSLDLNDDASLIENIITKILMGIGETLYTLLSLVVGETFSIERVIFNDYTNTKLGFFEDGITGENEFIESTNIKKFLNDFYNFFNGIAIAVYLIILIYMAIRIMLGSTAEKGSKYKELVLYWVEGVLILFLFPYMMKYAIMINNSFVSYVYEGKDTYIDINMPEFDLKEENMPEEIREKEDGFTIKNLPIIANEVANMLRSGTDFMSVMYQKAVRNGWLVYAICWYVMFFQMVGFLVVYFKRLLVMMFLIAVFPLVMISYAIDKVGDTKSQAFDNWIKEFMTNVFVQSFHAITYVLIMSLICQLMDDPSENWLLILIALSFISKGDDILRPIFSLRGSANTVKGIGSTLAQAAIIREVSKGAKDVKNRLIGKDSLIMKVYSRGSKLSQKVWDKAENRVERTANELQEKEVRDKLESANASLGIAKEQLENSIKNDLEILLGKKSGVTNAQIRNAADKITGYMNNEKDKDTQELLKNLIGGYSDEEQKILKNLLKQNAAANRLKLGGTDVNVTNNINIIIECMKRAKKDKSGKATATSLAILGKVVDQESDLQEMQRLLGKIKFRDDKVIVRKNSSTKSASRTFEENNINNRENIVGRNAAKSREGIDSVKTELEYRMKNKGKSPIGKTRQNNSNVSKYSNTSNTFNKQSVYRFSKNGHSLDYEEEILQNEEETSKPNKSFIPVSKTQDDIRRALELEMANKIFNNMMEENKGFGKVYDSGVRASKEKVILNVPEKEEFVDKNTAKHQAEVEDDTSEEIINRILRELKEENSGFSNVIDMNVKSTMNQYLNYDMADVEFDLAEAKKAVDILNAADTGRFSGTQLLKVLDKLKTIIDKYKFNSHVGQELEKIVSDLGCTIENYESYLRIEILNNPDSVRNNREIIEECKKYVKETEMPSFLLNSLNYDLGDLVENKNLKYVQQKDSKFRGFVSKEEKSRTQEEYEAKLKFQELKEANKKLDKDNAEKYSKKSFAKDGVGLVGTAILASVDTVISTVDAAGVGFIASGMATNGSKETISEGIGNVLAGYTASNVTYDNLRKSIKDTSDEVKDVLFSKKDEKKEEKKKKEKVKDPTEYIKDKTRIDPSFFNDNKKK